MRKKLAAVIGGLVLIVAPGLPATAQAAAIPSGLARAKVAAAQAADCAGDSIWDYGNQKYAAINDNNFNLYFEPLSTLGAAPLFCNVTNRDANGQFEIEDYSQPGVCLDTEVSGDTNSVTDVVCDAINTYELWSAINTGQTYHSQTLWQLENVGLSSPPGPAECLYDDTQEPVTFAPCSDSSDHFEWFVWDALP
jgi:hypothetical protein